MSTIYFSKKGLEAHRRAITRQEKRLREATRQIGEAAGPGCDWHDNFEYENARRQSEMEERKLEDLRIVVQSAVIFEPVEQSDVVKIGSTVSYTDVKTGATKEVTIGAFSESDPNHGLLTYETPIARALIGRRVSDEVEVQVGQRRTIIKVTEIYPPSHKYQTLLETLFKEEA